MLAFVPSLCFVLAASAPDPEAPKEKARQLVSTANAFYAKQEYQAALALYQRAFAVYANPMLNYNIARTHQMLGDLLRAAEHYERFLAESGAKQGSERFDLTTERLKEIDAAVGRLTIRAPAGAEVRLDGTPIAPSSMRVLPGDHEITATLPRHLPFRTVARVEAGASVEVKVDPIEEVVAPIAIAADPIAAEPESTPVAETWWFWTLLAAGAAVAAGVTTAVVLNQGEFSRTGELDTSSTGEWESY